MTKFVVTGRIRGGSKKPVTLFSFENKKTAEKYVKNNSLFFTNMAIQKVCKVGR